MKYKCMSDQSQVKNVSNWIYVQIGDQQMDEKAIYCRMWQHKVSTALIFSFLIFTVRLSCIHAIIPYHNTSELPNYKEAKETIPLLIQTFISN